MNAPTSWKQPGTWGPWRLEWLPDDVDRTYDPQLAYAGAVAGYDHPEGFPLWYLDTAEKLVEELRSRWTCCRSTSSVRYGRPWAISDLLRSFA
jgi:hypothetical protein